MKLNKRAIYVILIAVSILFSACSSEEFPPATEQYTVTTDETQTQKTEESNFTQAQMTLSPRQLPRSKMDVLQMYAKAVDLVKLRCPGFTRTLSNEIYEINADGDGAELLNAAMSVLVEDDRSADSVITVSKDDDLACRTYFPVYDTDYGCRIIDGSSVSSAVCYDYGVVQEIIILFREQLSPDPWASEFGQIMTPFSEKTLLQNLNAYVPALSAENCKAALRYFNCEIRCVIDPKSGHMISLSQKMVTEVSLKVEMDLILTAIDLTASGTMINHLDFTDFVWH